MNYYCHHLFFSLLISIDPEGSLEFWTQYAVVQKSIKQGWAGVFRRRHIDKLAGLASTPFQDAIYCILKESYYD